MKPNPFLLLLPLLLCTGFVWRNPCPSDSVLLQKVNRKGPTRIVLEGKNIISSVDRAFVYNVGYRRIIILAATPATKRFVQEVIDGNCAAKTTAIVVPEASNPYRDVFRVVSP